MLDFGLAKVAAPDMSATDLGDAETLTVVDEQHLTTPGMVVGTVAYMSPEQVRAQPLDARSDLFSFGIVLYQMATRRLPFQGTSTWMVFEAIVKQNSLVVWADANGDAVTDDGELHTLDDVGINIDLAAVTSSTDTINGNATPFTRSDDRPTKPSDVKAAVDALGKLLGRHPADVAQRIAENLRSLVSAREG